MKTKLILLVIYILSNTILIKSQTLSREVRNDFCVNAKYNYFYGTNSFFGLMNITLKRIGISDPYKMNEAVKNICNDELLQNSFFESIHKESSIDKLQYLSIGMRNENVEKLVEYYYLIDDKKRKKEWELSRLENEKELKSKITNNETFYLYEISNKPKLQIIDSINIKNELQQILNSTANFSLNERYINYDISYSFEVDTKGNIVNLINKTTEEKIPMIFKTIMFNEGGIVFNKNQKKNVSFYYPFKISVNNSSNYKEFNITVKLVKGKVLIEQIDLSNYASSPAGKISFENRKAKSFNYFEELKKHLLKEKPLRTTKTSFFNNEYRTFKVSKNTLDVSFIIDENKNICRFDNVIFDISELGNK